MKIVRKLRNALVCTLLTASLTVAAWAQTSEVTKALESIHDMDPAVRLQAVYVIQAYAAEAGKADEAVAPLLESYDSEPDNDVKKGILAALAELATKVSNPKPIVDKLTILLDSDDQAAALTAAAAFERLQDLPAFTATSEKRFAAIERGLKSSDSDLAVIAIEALSTDKAERAHGILVKLLDDPEQRTYAVRALLSRKDAAAQAAVASFARTLLGSDNAESQELGLEVIAVLEAPTDDFKAQVIRLAGADNVVGVKATRVLYQLDPPLALPLWKQQLLSQDSEVRTQSLAGMASLASTDYAYFFDTLSTLLGGALIEDDQLYILNLLSYQELVPQRFLPAVLKSAASDSPMVRTVAADLLARFGPDSARGIPALTGLLKDKEAEIQIKSLISVYKITGDMALVKTTLDELLKDSTMVATLLNSAYGLENSPFHNRILEELRKQALAGDATALATYSYQSGEIDPLALKAYLANFDKLDSSTRNYMASRLSSMHPARPGVMEFIKKCLNVSGDERWSALTVYLRFTGDYDTAFPIVSKALESSETNELSYALSILSGDKVLSQKFLPQLKQVALGSGESYLRQLAFGVIGYTDINDAVELGLQLLRKKELNVLLVSDNDIYRKMGEQLAPSDRSLVAEQFSNVVQDSKNWYDRETELSCLLNIFQSTKGWPESVLKGLTRLEKDHPSSYIRETALAARKNQE